VNCNRLERSLRFLCEKRAPQHISHQLTHLSGWHWRGINAAIAASDERFFRTPSCGKKSIRRSATRRLELSISVSYMAVIRYWSSYKPLSLSVRKLRAG